MKKNKVRNLLITVLFMTFFGVCACTSKIFTSKGNESAGIVNDFILKYNLLVIPKSPTTSGLYQYLKKNYPTFDNITYSAPTMNILRADNWLLQTPNIWGFDLSDYQDIFTRSKHRDQCFNLPTCSTDTDCFASKSNFPVKCIVPNFLATSAASGCPNNTTTPKGQKLCISNAQKILLDIYDDIIIAQKTVDITMLNSGHPFLTNQKFKNGQAIGTPDPFFFVLKQAFTDLSHKTTGNITARLLGGSTSTTLGNQNAHEFLQALTSGLSSSNKLTIVTAAERSCPTLFANNYCHTPYVESNDLFSGSWDHGKIIAVDNNSIIVGGENLWGGDYLGSSATNDSLFRMEGPITQGANTYVNILFKYLASLYFYDTENVDKCIVYEDGKIQIQKDTCSQRWSNISPGKTVTPVPAPNDLSVPALFVSKLSGGLDVDPVDQSTTADQSEPARIFAIANAESSVKIAQQGLFQKGYKLDKNDKPVLDGTIWPVPVGSIKTANPLGTMQAIARVFDVNINQNRDATVQILTSSFSHTDGYGSDAQASHTFNFLCELLVTTFKHSKSSAQAQLQKNLQIGYVSYLNGATSGGMPAHHNKFWMVDDNMFYFGSHNFYPSSLQQFGIVTESKAAAKIVNDEFWNKLWSNADFSNFSASTVECNF